MARRERRDKVRGFPFSDAIYVEQFGSCKRRRGGEIEKLKAKDGPDLQVYGSGNLVQMLLKHDLVDELWLKVFPVTLGPGKRLFAEGPIPAAFTLIESKVSPKGVIVANYARAGEVEMGSFESKT